MNKIDLTIIIPTYNVEDYILETLQSVIKQETYFLYEVIIIDDGSTDGTTSKIKEFIKKNHNFRLYINNNHGAGYSRNYGLSVATGEYILFLDGDDLISNGLIQSGITEMKNNNLDVLFFSGESFGNYRESTMNYLRSSSNKIFNGEEVLLFQFKKRQYLISPCLYISKREHIEKNNIRFPQGIIYEDSYFTFFNTLYARRTKIIIDIFFQRRIRKNSVMQSSYLNQLHSFTSSFEVFKLISKEIESLNNLNFKIKKDIIFLQFRGAVSEFYKMNHHDQKCNKRKIQYMVDIFSSTTKKNIFPRLWVYCVKIKHCFSD